ncbi:hypothetical protein TMatcc_003154 [Talaromyces marneffei ATCC 18224]|uniref:Pyridoxamine 5'-phosphate oxidase Alr4036 family FMN-binding domain-containing protein n=2 Tax=Talaromyces marneffei TaxID=37727 RepID=B6Q5X7_TALMQ|nr:uncharacterized protein EYB26_001799 [Talaromyces marneffei]EEA28516.1 conserved hypothetical protein [Talaromyces marneffei ATCC 18224]KAE8555858.1 hypothetical protein EYB25_000556 [Talaromyces marneffei]QGA14146.1 hypothetical protein EYB26_001799 [Talaromyces marneffei]
MTATSSIPPAPWRSLFLEHISKLDDPYMSVSTVAFDPKTGSPLPRVRTCGFRGFFGELKIHPSAEKQLKDGGEMNPSIYESDMIAFTTDVRMEKVEQLKETNGAIEVMFWVKEVMGQWRLKGKAFIIGDDGSEVAERAARSEIAKGLRNKPGDATDGDCWSWEKEVTAYFANHSPLMRGSFKGPRPGTPHSQKPEDPNLRLGQKVNDLHDSIARGNFRVVVIRVEEVDRIDLNNPEEAKRWRTTLDQTGHQQWEEVELWP